MLEAVRRNPLLGVALPHERAFVDIVVHAVHVGVRMVNHVVFQFPDECVAAQGIKRQAHEFVHPFLARIAAVAGIVHDVEADAGQDETKAATEQYSSPDWHLQRQQGSIDDGRRRKKDDCLGIQVRISGFADSVLLEILIHGTAERTVKQAVFVVEGYF